MAGLLMHEAMAMDVEAGVPPMTVIQAATLNVAMAAELARLIPSSKITLR